ncbi:MAG TPA: hypothetical protein VJ521_09015 [Acidobacteriota bacterium]|nr:hypothetical protein [Acidobacteriota bacterium]
MHTKILAILLLCAVDVSAEPKLEPIDAEVRQSYIKRAQVWRPTEVSKMDVWLGPQNEIAVAPGTEVSCKYVEPKEKPSGAISKFKCELINGQTVRVKYGKNTGEVFAEIAASRLLWALGFYADEVYPVKVRCEQCPANPSEPKEEARQTWIIQPAIIEREYPGAMIQEKEDQGWAWKELDEIDPKEGGAPIEQVDALKLLAVLIQHGDQKPSQQRIGCMPEDLADDDGDGLAVCKRPVMMVQDLGATFGRAGQFTLEGESKMNFERWSKNPVWNEMMEKEEFDKHARKVCIGDLTNSGAAGREGLQNPIISEEGRKFLAGLLSQFTEKQIGDLFRAARADKRNEWVEGNGQKRRVTVDDWTQAFLKKRQEIIERQCEESTAKPKEKITSGPAGAAQEAP